MEEKKVFSELDYSNDPVARTAFENFGIKYLFPWQRLVISNILEAFEACGSNKSDIPSNEDSYLKGRQIVLLPTGAGKSLCFLVPAIMLPGITLIIYPLLALMTDQQRRMTEGSLQAVMFRGGQDEQERNEYFSRLKDGRAKVIIANPEVLQSQSLLERIKSLGIVHIAIDEAHCVSEWGDSFRPSYLTLGNVIEKLSPPVITAFTATASPSVLQRVSEILFSGSAHVVRSECDRQNIHYYVKKASVKEKEVILLCHQMERPLIVFCGTRNKTEHIARELNMCYGNDFAKFYHAGLEKSEKEETEKWFYDSKDGVLCATCAYGMGVDKKNIKTVIHLDAPQTAEAYIQEAGRGGRDGSVAKAVLLWSGEDSLRTSQFPPLSRERALHDFAETTDCRRQVLLDSLGGEKAVCSGCDLCDKRKDDEQWKEKNLFLRVKRLISERRKISDGEYAFRLIKRNRRFYSAGDLEEILYERMNNISCKITGKRIWSRNEVLDIIKDLEIGGIIKQSNFLWKNCYTTVNRKKDKTVYSSSLSDEADSSSADSSA